MDTNLLRAPAEIVGERDVITDPEDQAPYLTNHRNYFTGRTPAVVFPPDHQAGRRNCKTLQG